LLRPPLVDDRTTTTTNDAQKISTIFDRIVGSTTGLSATAHYRSTLPHFFDDDQFRRTVETTTHQANTNTNTKDTQGHQQHQASI
jgi:hypothetical protein